MWSRLKHIFKPFMETKSIFRSFLFLAFSIILCICLEVLYWLTCWKYSVLLPLICGMYLLMCVKFPWGKRQLNSLNNIGFLEVCSFCSILQDYNFEMKPPKSCNKGRFFFTFFVQNHQMKSIIEIYSSCRFVKISCMAFLSLTSFC